SLSSGRQSTAPRPTLGRRATSAANGSVGDRRATRLRGRRSRGAQRGTVLLGRDPGRTASRVSGPEPLSDRGHGCLPELAELASVAGSVAVGPSGGGASSGLAGARHGTAGRAAG